MREFPSWVSSSGYDSASCLFVTREVMVFAR